MNNIIKRFLLILIFTLISIFAVQNAVKAETIGYNGQVWYGSSAVGDFTVDGGVAFCIDHDSSSPGSGTWTWGEGTDNGDIVKCLYYGYGGKEPWWGFESREAAIVKTTLALDHYVHGTTRNAAQDFIDFVDSQSVPEIHLNFSNRNLTAHVEGDKQVTNQTTIIGAGSEVMTLTLQDNVTLVCDNRGWSHTGGTVNVSLGDVIHFEAPLTVNGTWVSPNITNSNYKWQAIIYRTESGSMQDLAGGLHYNPDPVTTTNLTINWVNIGNLEILKTDSRDSSPIANTVFDVFNSSSTKVGTITTNAEGKGQLNDLTVGTYSIKETAANNNYIADSSTYYANVTAGTTTTKTITNTIKKAKVRINKEDKDYSAVKISGAVFEIYEDTNRDNSITSADTLIQTLTTGSDGTITSNNLAIDKQYLVREKTANNNYILNTTAQKVTFTYTEADTVKDITFKNTRKKGNIKVTKVDSRDNTTPVQGTKFEVYSLETGNTALYNKKVTEGTTNSSGIVTFNNLRVTNYKVKEVSTNEWYYLDNTEKTLTVNADQTTSTTITNRIKLAYISVTKRDKDYTNIKLEGVTFKIYDGSTLVDTLTTNSSGFAKSKALPIDRTYTVKETATLSNYILQTASQTVTYVPADEGTTRALTFDNKHKEGNLKIKKVNKENPREALGNVPFVVKTSESYFRNKYLKWNATKNCYDFVSNISDATVWHTDVNGYATFSNLRIGNYYTLVELETNEWFKITDTINFEIQYNRTLEMTVTNTPKSGTVRIFKVDSEEPSMRLEGIEFDVYADKNENGIPERNEYVETVTTDENGEATTQEYGLRDYYKMLFVETQTDEYHILNRNIYGAVLEMDRAVTITIPNEPKKGRMKVIKQDSFNSSILLQGVKFKLYMDLNRNGIVDDEDRFMQELTTDENGEAVSDEYRIDRQYLLQEEETLNNYILDQNPIVYNDLIWNGTVTRQMTNRPKTITLNIDKKDSDLDTPIEGITFKIYEDTNNNEELDDEDRLIDSITTDAEGKASSKAYDYEDTSKILRLDRKYFLVEDDVWNYVPVAQSQYLDFTPYLDEEYSLELTHTLTIFNDPKKGKILIVKRDSQTNKPMEGIVFKVTDENGNLIEYLTTDNKGKAESSMLRIDHTYFIQEIETDRYHILNENTIEINVNWNQISTLNITNDVKEAKIKVIKTDSIDKRIKVPGVTFEIRDKETGKVLDTIITDENGEAVSKLLRLDGNFILVETKSNVEYNYDPMNIEFDLTEFIENYRANPIKDITLENVPKLSKIKVTKQDIETNKYLPNCKIAIYKDMNGNNELDKDDKKIKVLITDEEGNAEIDNLRYGVYFVYEIEAPEGYVLNEQLTKVFLKDNNQTETVKFKNMIIKNEVIIHKSARNKSFKLNIEEGEGVSETHFAIYYRNDDGTEGDLYKEVVTGEDGTIKITLPYGKYIVREIKPHDFFLNDSDDLIIDVVKDGKIATLEFQDTAVNIALDISKTGIMQAQPNDEIRYDFPDLINKSNVALDDFTWFDHLPAKYTKITKLFTGIWNEDVELHVYYKTNKNNWREFGKGYSSLKNNFIDFESLGLNNEDDEYITDFKVEFGTVKAGFTYKKAPFIFVKVDSDISPDDVWVNKTRLTGNYTDVNGNKVYLEDEDQHSTYTYGKELKIDESHKYMYSKLPRTGNGDYETNELMKKIFIWILALGVGYIMGYSIARFNKKEKKNG